MCFDPRSVVRGELERGKIDSLGDGFRLARRTTAVFRLHLQILGTDDWQF